MSKQIIGAVIGGLILFIWQFLSFSLLGIHSSQMAKTDQQDAILENLAAANLPEGMYFIPQPMTNTAEDREAHMNKYENKPWARVSYHHSLDMSMGMNLVRGLIIDLVAAFLLVWLLTQMSDLNFKTALLSSLAVGLIGYLSINYLNHVWFEEPSLPDLVDAVVQWGAVGAWLGFWLPR